jgi:nucleotide-binding universal stress UspA family protein
MSYRAIMVHVGPDQDSDARIQVARQLAQRWSAALIGIAAIALESSGSGDIVGVEESGTGSGDIVGGDTADPAQGAEIFGWLDRLRDAFRARGIGGREEWRSAIDYPTDFLIRESGAADLLVVGPAGNDRARSVDPGAAIVGAGRPVLLVPRGVGMLEARRVLIAWKNEREARRAVSDAMPFLEAAGEVLAVEVAETRGGPQRQSKLAEVAEYLSRRDIRADTRLESHSEASIGHDVLRLAREYGADLIVSGCLGRSALSEFLFGGVTRDLLAHSPVCCLLSH